MLPRSRSSDRGPDAVPARGAPSGAVVITTETDPALCACIFKVVGEVCLGVLESRRCAHPSPARGKPIVRSDRKKRSAISHLLKPKPSFDPFHYLLSWK